MIQSMLRDELDLRRSIHGMVLFGAWRRLVGPETKGEAVGRHSELHDEDMRDVGKKFDSPVLYSNKELKGI